VGSEREADESFQVLVKKGIRSRHWSWCRLKGDAPVGRGRSHPEYDAAVPPLVMVVLT
jgi:hypothetical protein